MNTEGTYKEQFLRLLRWYERLEGITKGRNHDRHSETYTDDVHAFFLNCYHLKDWLINDQSFAACKGEVEAFINGHLELQICADICNATKHLRLDRERSHQCPALGARDVNLTLGNGTPQISIRFIVETKSCPRDAFELAGKCLALWREFLCKFGESV